MPFNDDYIGWQYASCVVAPKKENQSKTLSSITVITAYDYNIDWATFDNISLRQEPCTTYTYDSKGNVTAVNATGNSSTDMTYAAGTNKLTKTESQANGTYEYSYEDSRNDHLVTKIKDDGVSMNISYDAMGNSISSSLAADSGGKKVQTSATYSTDGSQLMSQNDSNGYTTSYTYDAQRNLLTSTDNAGTQTNSNYYNENDRPSMTFQSGVISTHFYYSCGMLTSVVRGGYISGSSAKQEQTYSMAYDGFGNMTSIAVGDRTLATYSYGSRDGNLSSMTYGNGTKVRYEYDNLDRVTKEYWNDTLKYRYFYNSEGTLVKKLDEGTGKAVNYEYDSLGRLIHSQQSENGTVIQRTEHIYDTENRIQSQSWQMGDTTYSQTYSYRESDGALTYIDMSPDTDMALEYDSLKRLSSRYNYYFRENYTYRDIDANRTTNQVAALAFVKRPGGSELQEFSLNYGYDSVGNISSVSSTVRTDQNATYTYDQQGQLLTENSYVGNWTYSYDTYGNIRSASNGTTTHTYTYSDDDWLDLLTAYNGQNITYDAIGNPTSYYNGTRWTFTWQNGRQLASAERTTGIGGIYNPVTTAITNTYDVAGIRDSKTVTVTTRTGSTTTTYHYVTQNGQVVRQTWGNHTLDIVYDHNSRPWAMFYDGTTYFYQLNLQGDVIGIVDTTGASVAKYAYDAWGRVVYSTGSMATVSPIRYCGYYYDAELEMYYLGGRYYDPQVKRFLNADHANQILVLATTSVRIKKAHTP